MIEYKTYFTPVDITELNEEEAYLDKQLGKTIQIHGVEDIELENIDFVIIGLEENRGQSLSHPKTDLSAIRKSFYKLYHWHENIRIADLGDLKIGATLKDSYAALASVLTELEAANKLAIIIGGSNDSMLGQYKVFQKQEKLIEATIVDALIDINDHSVIPEENYLIEMLTAFPNFISHYTHLGFQSYMSHPMLLENMQKLHLDAVRLGNTRENLNNYEPFIRNSTIFGFDLKAIAYSFAPGTAISPNGYTGDEACMLLRFAGMATNMKSIGIYGYNFYNDTNDITAMQVAQMIWYAIDGLHWKKQELPLYAHDSFIQYHLTFDGVAGQFKQSRTTKRWWMMLPDGSFTPCSEDDYKIAAQNKIPERWFKAQEKS